MGPETPADVTPEAPAPKPITREEAVLQIRAKQEDAFQKADYAERLMVARRGYRDAHGKLQFLNPSFEPTHEELKAIINLKRDSLHYLVEATNKFGLLSVGKQKGRRHSHMTKHQQAIKSESIRIFGQLFTARAETLQAVCKKESIEYIGVPESALPTLAARAAKIALEVVNQKRTLRAKARRRLQQFHRSVNVGLLPGNFGERNFVHAGGQYGR